MKHTFSSAQQRYFAAKAAYDALNAELAAYDATLDYTIDEDAAHTAYMDYRDSKQADEFFSALLDAENGLLNWAYQRSLKMVIEPAELEAVKKVFQASQYHSDTFRLKIRAQALDLAARLI